MRLKALSWTRYRAFKEATRVEFSPLSIVIGKNGSGKSLISRLPLLVANAISETPDGVLSLTAGGIEHAASFLDFAHQRSALPFSLGMEASDGDASFSFEATLRYINETRSLTVEGYSFSDRDGELLSLTIDGAEQLTSLKPRYIIRYRGDADRTEEVAFSGLLPVLDAGELHNFELFDAGVSALRRALPMPSYLGPFREEPSRTAKMPGQSIKELGPRGERALELLTDDRLRQGGVLIRQVSEWFSTALHQKVEVDINNDPPRLYIVDRLTGLQVSLADTGAGFAQVLPVVVQHFAYRIGRLKTSTLIVEQPELHLHPAAHGAVADLILETASPGKDWEPATCIVETHSEQFIMRLRRRVAEGADKDRLKILSLGHIEDPQRDAAPEPIREIVLDERGNPDSWPAGVFEEALDDLTAARKAARSSGN